MRAAPRSSARAWPAGRRRRAGTRSIRGASPAPPDGFRPRSWTHALRIAASPERLDVGGPHEDLCEQGSAAATALDVVHPGAVPDRLEHPGGEKPEEEPDDTGREEAQPLLRPDRLLRLYRALEEAHARLRERERREAHVGLHLLLPERVVLGLGLREALDQVLDLALAAAERLQARLEVPLGLFERRHLGALAGEGRDEAAAALRELVPRLVAGRRLRREHHL